MDDLLFEVPEMKSPRLRWMEEYRIFTFEGRDEWIAHHKLEDGEISWDEGRGETEGEALGQLALKLGILLWNEGWVDRGAAPGRSPGLPS